jgi:hypothetical protein
MSFHPQLLSFDSVLLTKASVSQSQCVCVCKGGAGLGGGEGNYQKAGYREA